MISTIRYKNGWLSERIDNRKSVPVYSGAIFVHSKLEFKHSISERAIKMWLTKWSKCCENC